jgi:hypothetical protein
MQGKLVFASSSPPETRLFFFLYSDKYKTKAVDTYICCQLIRVHVYAEFSYFLLAGAALLDLLLILGLNIVFATFSTPDTEHFLCFDKFQTLSC